jgi:hypothetical protein
MAMTSRDAEQLLNDVIGQMTTAISAFETKRSELVRLDSQVDAKKKELNELNSKTESALTKHDQILDSINAIKKQLVRGDGATPQRDGGPAQ